MERYLGRTAVDPGRSRPAVEGTHAPGAAWMNGISSRLRGKSMVLERMDQIKYAILETNGMISIVPKTG
jgi:hypothetical protein